MERIKVIWVDSVARYLFSLVTFKNKLMQIKNQFKNKKLATIKLATKI